MKKSYRDDILKYAAKMYKTQPEYLWARDPNYAVLRRSDNRKWYGIIMDVPRVRLGMDGDEIVDILNVKCAPGLYSFCVVIIWAEHGYQYCWMGQLN